MRHRRRLAAQRNVDLTQSATACTRASKAARPLWNRGYIQNHLGAIGFSMDFDGPFDEWEADQARRAK